MTTMAENERLAVLENQYRTLQSDVTEIKSDVKALVATQASLATALAIREAAEQEHRMARASTGVWIRSLLPLIFSGMAVLIAVLTFITSH